jgi:outer membrane protein assembly factor BamB
VSQRQCFLEESHLEPKCPTLLRRRCAVHWLATDAQITSPVAGSNGLVYAGTDAGTVFAVDAATGALVWAYTAWIVIGAPALSQGLVMFGDANGVVLGLDAETGLVAWRATTYFSGFMHAPLVFERRVIFASSQMVAIDTWYGYQLWSSSTVPQAWAITSTISAPALSPDGAVLYIGCCANQFMSVSTVDGTQLWSVVLSPSPALTASIPSFESSPAVDEFGVVYVGFGDRVWSLNADDGHTRWSYTIPALVRSSPTLGSGGMLYIGAEDGVVRGLALTCDRPCWSCCTFLGVRRHTGREFDSWTRSCHMRRVAQPDCNAVAVEKSDSDSLRDCIMFFHFDASTNDAAKSIEHAGAVAIKDEDSFAVAIRNTVCYSLSHAHAIDNVVSHAVTVARSYLHSIIHGISHADTNANKYAHTLLDAEHNAYRLGARFEGAHGRFLLLVLLPTTVYFFLCVFSIFICMSANLPPPPPLPLWLFADCF